MNNRNAKSKTMNQSKYIIAFSCVLFLSVITHAQSNNQIFKASGSPVNPKVAITWNKYYDHGGITEICRKIVAAYPNLAKLESIGKSFKGRDMWVLIITD